MPFAPPARAAYTAVITCNPCSTISAFQTAAQNWANTKWAGQPGTVLLVTSQNAPMSVMFKIGSSCGAFHAKRCVPRPVAQQTTPEAAAALDNLGFTRAAKFGPIKTPPTLTYTEVDENIGQFIRDNMLLVPGQGISWWHDFPNFQPTAWYILKNLQTGQIEKIWVGDQITVQYGDSGYSEKWTFKDPHLSIAWERVPNTLMYKGKPVHPPVTPATPLTGGYGGIPNLYNLPGNLAALLPSLLCYGTSSVTIYVGDDSYTSFGFFAFPC